MSVGNAPHRLAGKATGTPQSPKKKRLYASTDSGTMAEMDERSEPGLNDPC
jgi:hypothetical protein